MATIEIQWFKPNGKYYTTETAEIHVNPNATIGSRYLEAHRKASEIVRNDSRHDHMVAIVSDAKDEDVLGFPEMLPIAL
jgi:hypothetical protein